MSDHILNFLFKSMVSLWKLEEIKILETGQKRGVNMVTGLSNDLSSGEN